MEVVWLGGLEMTQRSFQKAPCSDCLKTLALDHVNMETPVGNRLL